MHIDYNLFEPKKYGFDMYSDILYTSEDLINNDPNTVDSFKEASLKGWEYAYSNIEASVDLILKKYNTQDLSKEELIYEANELKKLSFYNTEILGLIEKSKIKKIADLYNIMGLLNKQIDINTFLYNKISDNLKLTYKEKKYLENKKIINMCIDPDWMPFEKNLNGKHIGLASDYIEIVKKHINIPINLVKTKDWDESIKKGKNRECDIYSMLPISSEIEKYMNFTSQYLDVPIVIATKTDKQFIDNFQGIIHKKIAIVKNYSIINILKEKYPDINIVIVESINDGLRQVESGKVFAFIDNLATINYEINKNFTTSIKVSGRVDIRLNYRMSTRNDEPILHGIFEKIISNIDENTKEKIYHKWINTSEKEKSIDYILILYISIAVILLILLFIYRQYSLKKAIKDLKIAVDEKTNDLQILNTNLELKINEEVSKNLLIQEQLFRSEKMASMGEMIANIAHQWRQPLSVITTSSTGMQMQKECGLLTDELFERGCENINGNAQYLSKTIDDFKNFIIGDREKVEFNLTQNINSFMSLIKGSLKNNNINIILNTNDNINMSGYPNELIQCMLNIFGNAKDALLENNIEPKLFFISTSYKDDKVIIKIKDNARGIPENILTKIFEPYFTTKHKSKGTGLGLHMTYNLIIDGMKGDLEANNLTYEYQGETFTGAQFIIVIPIT